MRSILEEDYIYGGCLYFAIALSRKHNLNLTGLFYYQNDDLKLESLSSYSSFKEIPKEMYSGIIIDHVYANISKRYYDIRGKRKSPKRIGEMIAHPFSITEEELLEVSELDKTFFEECVESAKYDLETYFFRRFRKIK